MITAIAIGVGVAFALMGLALLLPCPACELRRQRLKAAYEAWRRRTDH